MPERPKSTYSNIFPHIWCQDGISLWWFPCKCIICLTFLNLFNLLIIKGRYIGYNGWETIVYCNNSSPKAVSGQRYPFPVWVVCDLSWGGAGQWPRRGQSPVDHRGDPSVHLSVRTYICPYVRPPPPAPSSGLRLLCGLFWPKFCQIAQIQAIWPKSNQMAQIQA